MSSLLNIEKINLAIRLLLYNCLFWIPYSPAVIEISVVLSVILWLVKHVWLSCRTYLHERSFIKAFSQLRPESIFLDKPVAVFLSICLISTVVSPYPGSAWLGFWFKTFEWFVVLYLVAETITTRPQVGMAVMIMLLTTFSTAIDGLQQFYLTGRDIFNQHELTRGGITAAFKHTNSLAAYLVAALPVFGIVPLLSALQRRHKIFGIVLFLIGGWAFVLTFSRMAWLAFILAAIGMLFVLYRRRAAGIVLIVFLFFGVTAYNLSAKASEQLRLGAASISLAVDWRTQIWKESFRLIKERPIFGAGLNTYMQIFEIKRDQDPHYPLDPTYAHNCYIQMLAEVGVAGLISFGWILMSLSMALGKIFRAPQFYQGDHDLFLVLLGLSAGAGGYLIHSFFDTNFYSVQLSVLFWFVAGLLLSVLRLLKPLDNYGIKNKLKFGEKTNA